MKRATARMLAGLSLACAGMSGAVGGCLAKSEPGLASRDPAERVNAMIDAAATRDPRAIPGLIERLDSQDGGERLLAITALRRITGETLGYDHAAPAAQRDEAAARWRAWERARREGNSAGASGPADGVNDQ